MESVATTAEPAKAVENWRESEFARWRPHASRCYAISLAVHSPLVLYTVAEAFWGGSPAGFLHGRWAVVAGGLSAVATAVGIWAISLHLARRLTGRRLTGTARFRAAMGVMAYPVFIALCFSVLWMARVATEDPDSPRAMFLLFIPQLHAVSGSESVAKRLFPPRTGRAAVNPVRARWSWSSAFVWVPVLAIAGAAVFILRPWSVAVVVATHALVTTPILGGLSFLVWFDAYRTTDDVADVFD